LQDKFNQWIKYSGLGFQLLAAILLGLWIGQYADRGRDKPLFALVGALTGTLLGLGLLIKALLKGGK
jgi:F0F1-type ATP synthase assembly protein I